MAHIYLDNKGFTVFVNKGQEVGNSIYEYTLTRGDDILVVETSKSLLQVVCTNFDHYVTDAKLQKVSTS